ncbi:anthrone oxygenase family protein [Nonomuraea sp. NPDC003804]|uniref:anthrone oxygenase family protein n=1 Tax=Nonomuraea sp. NPDC003804 TaxID=3154547 RepID=UPI00339EFE3E
MRIVLGLSALATGLVAGTYYGFSIAVMPGLAAAGDRTFVAVMNHINAAIINPAFLAPFLAGLVLPIWALIRHRRARPAALWILAGLALYLVGFVTTSAVNVPLNDALAAGTLTRAQFEGPWVAWNLVRAVLSTAATACLVRAMLEPQLTKTA